MKKSSIFIHIPKTGGTSVNYAMAKASAGWAPFHKYVRKKYIGTRISKDAVHIGDNESGNHGHQNICAIYTENELKKYELFTVVRNPYSRLVSLFEFYRSRFQDSYWVPKNNMVTFDSFVRGLLNRHIVEPGTVHRKGFVEGYDLYISPSMPQVSWLPDPEKINVKVYKLENLNSLFDDFKITPVHQNAGTYKYGPQWTAGLERHSKDLLKKVKSGLSKNWKPYYNQERLDIVNSIYSDDFIRFNYKVYEVI